MDGFVIPIKKKNIKDYKKLAKLKPDETAIFAFIIYKSKTHRGRVNKKVMADKRMTPENWKHKKMPFDMKRFTAGEFKVLVSA